MADGADITPQVLKVEGGQDVQLRVVEMVVVGAGDSVPSLRRQISQVSRPVPRFGLATDHPGLGDGSSHFSDDQYDVICRCGRC